jgi:hypothetical protein
MAKIKIIPVKKEGEINVVIIRTHYTNGINGKLYLDGTLHSYCIELPWKDNRPQVSCIPEGQYKLGKRFSEHLGHHLQVLDVPDRELILIHPANDAKKELKGCIAPVTSLTGEGRGLESRKAFDSLVKKIYAAIDLGENAQLAIITPKNFLATMKQTAATLK